MPINLKPSNEYRKVKIIEIVTLQGDDYNQAMRDLNQEYDKDYQNWTNEKDLIDYMLQWYMDDDDFYMAHSYNAYHINSPFLGYLRKIKGYMGYFLLSINHRLEYLSLSKILSIE